MMRTLGLLLPVLLVSAQEPAPPTPTIRTTTRLVQVNVVVRSGGKPVDDLKKDEFELLDNGKPQKIAFSSMVNATAKAQTGARPLPAGVYSNQVDRLGETPTSITVVLFDGLNTPLQDQIYARQQIVRFLKKLTPQDRVAVYVLGRRLRVLHDFTTNFEDLQRSLERYRGENIGVAEAADPVPNNTGNPDLDAFLDEVDGRYADFQNVRRAETTAQAMETIAKHLSVVPGRKSLVWVSAAFPFVLGFTPETFGNPGRENRTFSEEIKRAARAMNEADIAVYPVDARGLMTNPNFSAAQSPRIAPGGRIPNMTFTPSNQDTMQLVADWTGGKAFYNTNDIGGAIRQAIDDAEVTYTLAFYPQEMDGKYHELKIRVLRKGVQVRHRRGYLALEGELSEARNREQEMRIAAAHPLDSAGIGMLGSVTSDTPAPGKWTVRVSIEPERITIQKGTDKIWRGTADILMVQMAKDGRAIKAVNDTLNININEDQLAKLREQVQKNGFVLTKTLDVEKEAATLRVIVYDRPSAALGSLRLWPVTVTQAPTQQKR
jgi:VWFA-related protein